jgi:hypothetical protein
MKPKILTLAFASLMFTFLVFVSCTEYESDGVFSPEVLEYEDLGMLTEEPDSLDCETAYAFGDTYATCFLEIDVEPPIGKRDFSRWGWTNGPLMGGSYSFEIYAGAGQCDLWRGTLVGDLSVDYDDVTGDVTVIYDVDSGWGLYETHLFVGCDMLPMKNGKYTVAPGHYGNIHEDLDGASSDTFMVNVDCLNGIYVVAHAVVCEVEDECDETIGIIYGMERNTGDVWKVNVLTGTAVLSFSSENPPPTSASPNGLAYDFMNDRIYYCDYRTGSSPRPLYFWDYTTGMETQAGTLPVENAAADYYNGKYYYVSSYPGTDDLHEVTLNPDGTIQSDVVIDDMSGNAHAWTFDGDIAILDGILYGWGRCAIDNQFEFFSYDLGMGTFAVYTPTFQQSLQLAFGSNGAVLYGHRSGGTGDFYEIDLSSGAVSPPITITPGVLYTDCASGQQCDELMRMKSE